MKIPKTSKELIIKREEIRKDIRKLMHTEGNLQRLKTTTHINKFGVEQHSSTSYLKEKLILFKNRMNIKGMYGAIITECWMGYGYLFQIGAGFTTTNQRDRAGRLLPYRHLIYLLKVVQCDPETGPVDIDYFFDSSTSKFLEWGAGAGYMKQNLEGKWEVDSSATEYQAYIKEASYINEPGISVPMYGRIVRVSKDSG